MQRATLGYGKTATGAYRPLLVDDGGRLVIDAAFGSQPVPFAVAPSASPRGVWLRTLVAYNGGEQSATVSVGVTETGHEIVDPHVVEPDSAEMLPIKNPFPEVNRLWVRSDRPVIVTVETGRYRTRA